VQLRENAFTERNLLALMRDARGVSAQSDVAPRWGYAAVRLHIGVNSMSENGAREPLPRRIMATMLLEPESCFAALQAHDPRFDGRFFVGVSSTGIYCRPICPARTPKRENCNFFPSAAAAEAAGFRPCLRCRPELAPGNASVDTASRLAQAAATWLENDAGNGDSLETLARRLSVSDGHLRRIFQNEFGVAPVQFAQTQRLLLAKRLLTDTQLSVSEVALASGLGSPQRLNALFRARYRLCPTTLRRKPGRGRDGGELIFELGYRPPYDFASLLHFLRDRGIVGVESVDDSSRAAYRRTLGFEHADAAHRGWIEVSEAATKPVLRVRVASSLVKVLPSVLTRVKRLFDLTCEPREIVHALGPLAAANPGLRLPGACDGFEIATRAVLGQQITVRAARTLAGRFVQAFGEPVATPFEPLQRLFPRAVDVADIAVDKIAALGIISARARTIVALARAVADGALCLESGSNVDHTLTELKRMPGIGEWTAQYIAMRALAWPDAFPHTDYGVTKALGENNPKRVLARAEVWRPWRAYAVMHLWNSLR
jgi:AraC family transcriptional regulator, regulatory protein of adaptative response / DNA-3-methyladenine glycosylase II